MQERVIRKLFLAFIEVHILSHAAQGPLYGSWMIEELSRHGYEISAGTLYPILHNLEKNELLSTRNETVNGKVRKYYSITEDGREVLEQAKKKINELTKEL